ncbi:HAD-superfamily hydrolase, subfamily IA, variant 1 [Thermoanaerobacter mathranii subsp. mathranii str. A3]|uniref:HAD-superfamily hydrolase, subfamily IA, variant 1 n=1 Tax=Thermoanaerobacter mathranii subsp. mathranii (strain DSM 11426 / CCUG 53645 / CIP 108742 / A3) TaxID=583358 RepID=A0ABM5LSF7_THEM3|nr:HAD-superfamily hydrolase, subfamily IA, variant 1 [Thermoanaerobacter mathranii subsp. mathranii str. A3]
MGIRTVLFDLDGTIIDTNELIIESFKYTIQKHLGYIIQPEEVTPYFGEPLQITLKRFSQDKWELMVDTYRRYNEFNHDKYTRIRQDVKAALELMYKNGIKMGIVTSKRRELAVRGLKLFDLEKYFKVIVALEDTERHKPHPDPIVKALEVLNANKEETLMVGDSPYDILCASNAGVKSVAVKWTILPFNLLEEAKPDYVINDMREILKII